VVQVFKREERMSIKEFYARDFKAEKIERKKKVYKVAIKAGLTTTILLSTPHIGFAAGTGIDVGATKLYDKILLVGKWIIIVKGAIDTINNTAQGDFASAKKSFLSYLIIYLILKAFPWAMNEVDSMFNDLV
jgi:hypothetical protein